MRSLLLHPLTRLRAPTASASRGGGVRSDLGVLLSPETTLEPLNAATAPWLRAVVWTDFWLAVSLFVVAPLAILGW